MFDPGFKSYLLVAGALVISPGATMAVVTDVVLAQGRAAALKTVAGVNIANSSLALASALGISFLLRQWPSLLRIVSLSGAVYLLYLGLRSLWRTLALSSLIPGRGRKRGPQSSPLTLGIVTNLLNPSVVLFYMLVLPRFIGRSDPFFARFLLLAASHVCMSLAWLTAWALGVGTLSERLARPRVRWAMGLATGLILVVLGGALVLK
jgi:threonine/homoserine/homoserine lactone efflux protein